MTTAAAPADARDNKMPAGIPFIISNEFAERFCFYGINSILTVYLVSSLHFTDAKPYAVIALYLLPEMNTRLRPKFWKELKVGTRIVANSFPIGGWEADRTFDVPTRYRHMFLYTVKPEHKRA